MAARKQLHSTLKIKPELERLLREARAKVVSEEELQEQRISFAFGNAPESDFITKESVRFAAEHIWRKSLFNRNRPHPMSVREADNPELYARVQEQKPAAAV